MPTNSSYVTIYVLKIQTDSIYSCSPRLVSFFQSPFSGTHPVSCPMGSGVACPGIEQPGREADQSPTSGAEMEDEQSYIRSPTVLQTDGIREWTHLALAEMAREVDSRERKQLEAHACPLCT
jgi:hypothetical protein